MAKAIEPRTCIWCTVNEIEHSFDIPLCVPCLVKIHYMTTERNFDANKEVQDYLRNKIKQKEPIAKKSK